VYRERCRSVAPLRRRRRCFISCCEWIVNKQRPTSIGVVPAIPIPNRYHWYRPDTDTKYWYRSKPSWKCLGAVWLPDRTGHKCLKPFSIDRANLNCSLLAIINTRRIDCRLTPLWIIAFPHLAPFSTVACALINKPHQLRPFQKNVLDIKILQEVYNWILYHNQ